MAQVSFRSADEVLATVEQMAPEILSTLVQAPEPVYVYEFIQQRFHDSSDVRADPVFQFLFRNFYRMDNAGLGDTFKTAFFDAFQLYRQGISASDIATLVNRLRQIETLRVERSLQFSFATKMAATINPKLPIYDAFVADLFDFSPAYHVRHFDKRLQRFTSFYTHLIHTIDAATQREALRSLVSAIGARLDVWTEIGWVKQIDFIFWTAGKILRSNQGVVVEET